MVVDSVGLPDEDLTVVEGVVATSLVRTTIDLLPGLSGGEALALADSALRAGADRDRLFRQARELGHDAGGFVFRVLEQAGVMSQSALESISRWLFLVSRLPRPQLQAQCADAAGPFAVVDFLWREQGVVGEADGLLKYDTDRGEPLAGGADRLDALRAEKLRQERLEQLGLIVVRWGWKDIVDRPEHTVGRVRAALSRGAARGGASGPRADLPPHRPAI